MKEFLLGEVQLLIDEEWVSDSAEEEAPLPSSFMIQEALRQKKNNPQAAFRMLKEMKKEMDTISHHLQGGVTLPKSYLYSLS